MGKGSGHFRTVAQLAKAVTDHEERIGIAEDRLNAHEQDIADLRTATKALARMDARHARMRGRKRPPSRRK